MAATEGQHGLNRVVADEPAIPESWHTDWHEPDRFFSEVEAMLEPYDSEVNRIGDSGWRNLRGGR